MDVPQKMPGYQLRLIRRSFSPVHLQRLLDLAGDAGVIVPDSELFPGVLRALLLLGEREGDDAGLVPVDRSVDLGEGPAVELGSGLEANSLGRNLDPDPFSGFGELAHLMVGCSMLSGEEGLVFAPGCPVLPGAIVELQLDRLWRLGRVEIDVGEELRVFRDFETVGRIGEEMLGDSIAGADSRM